MSSRRTMTRSSSGEGRSSSHNGDDVSGSSRPSSRSYLSNVRPENRSTLCSVMAQLTEETQPSFETTLKSKAVSENCNVKFSCVVTGYPTPDVIWYKDDMQLDRYCGLPKYEIFRNGQNYSLHIYNCTVEDAAIYQASARNIKGIVSCSGVLEVGVMNEFKIHQRYFAKLKQKAENKRRELEGKENQGPGHQEQLRHISPDRSQRKRRSPMEAYLSTPSSTEDEGIEDSHEVPVAETEARLQETTMEEVKEKPGPITNGAVSPSTNGQTGNENGSMTYIYDSGQKTFTAHQPKTPFVKKKIKISKGVKAERVSEERRANEEASVALASTESAQSQGTLREEIMEVQSAATTQLSNTSTDGTLAHRDLESVDGPCESKDALPQRPCEQSRDQLSEKETSPSPKNVSVSRPSLLNEVRQAHAQMNRNGAPVNLEPLTTRCDMDAQSPQRSPSGREPPTDDNQTLTLHSPVRAASDKMTQGTWDHSRGSNESHTVLFTGVQKSPLESPSDAKTPENTRIRNPNESEQQIKGFKEIPTQLSKVISIAELLRSQMRALDSTAANSESSLSMVEAFSKTDSLTPPNTEASPLLRKRNGSSAIPSATPQELASGARRKILIPKPKTEEGESTSPDDNQPQKEEVSTQSSKLSPVPVPGTLSVSPGLSRRSPLLQPSERTSPVERRSPLLSRKKVALETPTPSQEPTQLNNSPKTEGKPAEKDKHDPFKAPQVIRKIRGESFSDASGHLKLWCQFFNILSDSTIQWYRDEVEIAQVIRSAGDETQVNLAIVQASSRDCGVYGCTITNEHGTDSTDFLLSVDILAGMSLREDLGVGEEIEMIPLLLNKGVADPGVWGNKFFGRIMMQESRIGNGVSHKVWRAKVIYGLEPVFESGTTCIIKARNPITYGGKGECGLIERNLDITKEECRIQNLAREYCKIFSAEARVIENFGPTLEVIPVYLIYRPANTIPHATVGVDLKGVYLKYSLLDHTGRLVMRTGSEVEQKCCALQHWIHQWTNGNLLLTQLEGVETKITQVGISIKSTGYQGLSATGNPKVFEQFVSQHQCNYFCGLLSLRSLKAMDSLMTPSKPKSSRSPLLQRKMAAGSSSPQTGRKAAGSSSPQTGRKAAGSSSPQTGRKAAGSSSPQTGRKAAGSSSPQTGRKAAVSPRLPRKSESVQDNNKASTK
ncbi:alpha-protein kinase 3 [Diretmus argenteus]